MTKLHKAAGMGDTEVVECLLNNGYQVDIKDSYDWTPLHYAAWWNRTSTGKLLIEYGTGELRTALTIAIKEGSKDIANLLRKHVAKELWAGKSISMSAIC